MTQTADTATKTVFLHTKIEKKQILIFLTNHLPQPFHGSVRYCVEGTDGRVHGAMADEVKAPADSTVQLIFFDRRELHEKKELLRMELYDDTGHLLQRTFADGPGLRPLKLRDPQLAVSVFLRAGRVFVSVHAARFARDVTLHCADCAFSENGFTLFADETKIVELPGAKADFAGAVTVTSAFDRK